MKATNSKWLAGATKVAAGAVLAASFLMPAVAQGTTSYVGKFTFTHETRWGSDLIPAGNYTLTVDVENKLIRVCDANTGKTVALEIGEIGTGSHADRSEILIYARGDDRRVSLLELAQLGEVYSREHVFPKDRRGTDEARATRGDAVQVVQK